MSTRIYLARPHVRHSEWPEEDHPKSAVCFGWWGRRTLPHDGSPSERSEGGGNNATRPLRSHAALAPAPFEPCAAAPARHKSPPRRLLGAGRIWREQPQPFAGRKRAHHCPRAVYNESLETGRVAAVGLLGAPSSLLKVRESPTVGRENPGKPAGQPVTLGVPW